MSSDKGALTPCTGGSLVTIKIITKDQPVQNIPLQEVHCGKITFLWAKKMIQQQIWAQSVVANGYQIRE